MGNDHFLSQISLDKPLRQNTPITEPRYRFDKTNDDSLHNALKDSLTNIDTNITTQVELEELAVTLCDKLMKAVNTSTPKVYSRNDPKSRISQAILDLIKEKRRLRQLYNSTQDPNIKSNISRLQKEIRTKINQESTISCEKFCNSISLESDPKKSWRKITNFLKPKGPRSYPLSDFLVGRVIQVKIEGFLSPKVYPKAGVAQDSNLSPLLFLIYVNDYAKSYPSPD